MKSLDWRAELFIWWHLTLPIFLWEIRGLKRCKEHGFHSQSWITGKCRRCDDD